MIRDCHDGVDEQNCFIMDCTEFRCDPSGQCISAAYVNDGVYKCFDKSHEMYDQSIECHDGFRCSSSECLNIRYVNDLVPN